MKKIIFPLDTNNINEAEALIISLKSDIDIFKVGLELFCFAGPQWVREIVKKHHIKIFLDLKLHDIPNTVLGAVRSILDIEPIFITVHLDEATQFYNTVYKNTLYEGFLCVTFLTSLDESDLHNLYVSKDISIKDYVIKKAELALKAGCKGIVCAAKESKFVKEKFGDSLSIITPGIRLIESGVPNDDQKRIVTPYDAIINGSDYLVIGRPIRNSLNPQATCKEINQDIDRALSQIK